MESQTVMGMAGGFIALAIMLGIGTSILGGAIVDCDRLPGAPSANGTATALNAQSPDSYRSGGGVSSGTGANTALYGSLDSWAYQCAQNSQNAQNAYSLLMVSLIVMGAAIVLLVVRFLTG